MKTITLGYSNFWNSVDPLDAEYFYRMFPGTRELYDIKITKDPDFMLYSVYGYITDKAPQATRILISCEGGGDHFAEGGKLAPGEYDPDFFHWGLTCWSPDLPQVVTKTNHLYMPPPLINVNLYNSGVRKALLDRPAPKRKIWFCDFIYSNPNSMDRRHFKDLLTKYAFVTCPGPVDTNVTPIRFTGYNKESYLTKQTFQTESRFSIAFENCYSSGYTTEKLTDPLIARSVPIYYGNPNVEEILNPASYIDVRRFADWQQAIEHVIEVDSTPKLYEEYLYAPPIDTAERAGYWSDHRYTRFFSGIFG